MARHRVITSPGLAIALERLRRAQSALGAGSPPDGAGLIAHDTLPARTGAGPAHRMETNMNNDRLEEMIIDMRGAQSAVFAIIARLLADEELLDVEGFRESLRAHARGTPNSTHREVFGEIAALL